VDLEARAVVAGQAIGQLIGVTAAPLVRAGQLVPLLTQHVTDHLRKPQRATGAGLYVERLLRQPQAGAAAGAGAAGAPWPSSTWRWSFTVLSWCAWHIPWNIARQRFQRGGLGLGHGTGAVRQRDVLGGGQGLTSPSALVWSSTIRAGHFRRCM
jgi:hypothetical protein